MPHPPLPPSTPPPLPPPLWQRPGLGSPERRREMAHFPSSVDQQCGAQQFCRRIWALQRLMDNLSCSICLDSQLVANSCNGHCCLQPHHSLLQCSSQHLLPFEAIKSTASHRARTSISPHASLKPITRPMQPQSTKHATSTANVHTLL